MKTIGRVRRHTRITKKMKGSAEQPRLTVFRSKKHIYAQLIDDRSNKVLSGCSSLSKEFRAKKIKSTDVGAAKEVGRLLAEKGKSIGIAKVCFDRAGYKYHGRIKALAEGAREGGLKF